ncbi:MAG: Lrp/AsnC family transcriptional regulator [Methanomassiliicoccales archaeon]|nr:Lrp/AsnC family transcriptional regulator [Methanomassiliicoccales archaeon]NYT14962.1 Lrp/AsnC family transcriptional regulator [Methanomassiliicoccales archaeon]
MDETDIQILKLLRRDSRQSLGKMAESIGISKATISRRITRMEENEIISGYTVMTNVSKMGVMRALLFLNVTGASLTRIIDDMRKFKEVEFIHKLFGDHSLLCEVYVATVDDLYQLIQDHILKIPGIQNVEVDILIDRIDMNPDAEFSTITTSSSIY